MDDPTILQAHVGDGWQTAQGAEVAALLDRMREDIHAIARMSEPGAVLVVGPVDVIGSLFTGDASQRTLDEARALGQTEICVGAPLAAVCIALIQRGMLPAATRVANRHAESAGELHVLVVATGTHVCVMRVRATVLEAPGALTSAPGGDA